MQSETVCVDDDDLLTPTRDWEVVESVNGGWMRCCPQCDTVLFKSSRDTSLRPRNQEVHGGVIKQPERGLKRRY